MLKIRLQRNEFLFIHANFFTKKALFIAHLPCNCAINELFWRSKRVNELTSKQVGEQTSERVNKLISSLVYLFTRSLVYSSSHYILRGYVSIDYDSTDNTAALCGLSLRAKRRSDV